MEDPEEMHTFGSFRGSFVAPKPAMPQKVTAKGAGQGQTPSPPPKGAKPEAKAKGAAKGEQASGKTAASAAGQQEGKAKKKGGKNDAQGPDGAAFGAGKKGRPSEDLTSKVWRLLQDFEASEESDKQFFGEQFKNFERMVERTHNAFTKFLSEVDESKHQVLVKESCGAQRCLPFFAIRRSLVSSRIPSITLTRLSASSWR